MKFSKPFIAVLAAFLFSTAAAVADTSILEATVKGPDGQAAKRAELRIERQDKKATAVMAKTDARGRYSVKALDAGTYRLTAKLPSGAQSMQVVKVQSGKPTSITFDMKQPTAAPLLRPARRNPCDGFPVQQGRTWAGTTKTTLAVVRREMSRTSALAQSSVQ